MKIYKDLIKLISSTAIAVHADIHFMNSVIPVVAHRVITVLAAAFFIILCVLCTAANFQATEM